MLVLIGYLGCNIILVLVVWFTAVTLITAAYAGAMASIVDIAPNFAGKREASRRSRERFILARKFLNCSILRRSDIGVCADDTHVREFPVPDRGWFDHPEERE